MAVFHGPSSLDSSPSVSWTPDTGWRARPRSPRAAYTLNPQPSTPSCPFNAKLSSTLSCPSFRKLACSRSAWREGGREGGRWRGRGRQGGREAGRERGGGGRMEGGSEGGRDLHSTPGSGSNTPSQSPRSRASTSTACILGVCMLFTCTISYLTMLHRILNAARPRMIPFMGPTKSTNVLAELQRIHHVVQGTSP